MSRLFVAYRVLAMIVGVLLAFCALVALPLKYLAPEGSDLQQFGESASIMWVVHGWVFMLYVVVTFLLARRARWSVPFTVPANPVPQQGRWSASATSSSRPASSR